MPLDLTVREVTRPSGGDAGEDFTEEGYDSADFRGSGPVSVESPRSGEGAWTGDADTGSHASTPGGKPESDGASKGWTVGPTTEEDGQDYYGTERLASTVQQGTAAARYQTVVPAAAATADAESLYNTVLDADCAGGAGGGGASSTGRAGAGAAAGADPPAYRGPGVAYFEPPSTFAPSAFEHDFAQQGRREAGGQGLLARALGWLGVAAAAPDGGGGSSPGGEDRAPEVSMVSRRANETRTVKFVPVVPGSGPSAAARPYQQYVVEEAAEQQQSIPPPPPPPPPASSFSRPPSALPVVISCLPGESRGPTTVPKATFSFTAPPTRYSREQADSAARTIPIEVHGEIPAQAPTASTSKQSRTDLPQGQGPPGAMCPNCTEWRKCIDCLNKLLQ